MISATRPSSNGWKGGQYTPGSRPTAVGGAGFGAPGTAAQTPPGVPSSSIMQARNNPGTNIRIPYARLVPMHGRVATAKLHTEKYKGQNVTAMVEGKAMLEYEGLRGGELAWILGRRMVQRTRVGENGLDTLTYTDMALDKDRPLHMSASAMGEGVNRMQRLASTPWMEAMFKSRFEDDSKNLNVERTINLASLALTSPSCTLLNSQLKEYRELLEGSSAMYSTNVGALYFKYTDPRSHYTLASEKLHAAEVREVLKDIKPLFSGGIDVYQTGPFLCGKELAHLDAKRNALHSGVPDTLEYTIKGDDKKDTKGSSTTMPIDLGDIFAQNALEAEMRRMDMMDWTPDGMILSKLASPAGDTLAQEELDAQSSQLFNVAVQGPALSTVWTSDLNEHKGDHKLVCQPMDKVFVCIVATLSYSTTTEFSIVTEAVKALQEALNGDESKELVNPDKLKDLQTVCRTVMSAREQLAAHCKHEVVEPDKGCTARKQRLDGALATWGDAAEAKDKLKKPMTLDAPSRYVDAALLSGFRLMRTTSSHMANYSKFDPSRTRDGENNTRLGLRLEYPQDMGDNSQTGVGEYIIGGWCIGTVIDSAASRATIHNLTNTAPASMAMNVHVNIEWWSADKLHRHYMDDRVHARGSNTVAHKRKNPFSAQPEHSSELPGSPDS